MDCYLPLRTKDADVGNSRQQSNRRADEHLSDWDKVLHLGQRQPSATEHNNPQADAGKIPPTNHLLALDPAVLL